MVWWEFSNEADDRLAKPSDISYFFSSFVSGRGVHVGGRADPTPQTLRGVTPAWLYHKGREEELCSRTGTMIFLSEARFLQSLGDPHPNPPKQTPGTGHVMQLKYLSWHERPIVPWWAVLDLSLQRKLNRLGKMSDMVKLYSSWHFSHAAYFTPAYLCGWRKDHRKL